MLYFFSRLRKFGVV
ncbi:hypothetical protein C369_07321 [Cryptococcus neoformans A5-35-17]|nr:hypothetical protein C369_07321 [Cryptococcus neoformans var. grubii A5-35-17]